MSLRQSLHLKDLPVFVLTTTTAKSIHEGGDAARAPSSVDGLKTDDAKSLLSIALEMVGSGCRPDGDALDTRETRSRLGRRLGARVSDAESCSHRAGCAMPQIPASKNTRLSFRHAQEFPVLAVSAAG